MYFSMDHFSKSIEDSESTKQQLLYLSSRISSALPLNSPISGDPYAKQLECHFCQMLGLQEKFEKL